MDDTESDVDSDEVVNDTDENDSDVEMELDRIHSRLDGDFFKEIELSLTSNYIYTICNTYMMFVAMAISFTTYSWILINNVNNSHTNIKLIKNLRFCEKTFAIAPFMAHGASAIAHLPYIPSMFLGISYISPEMITSLNGDKASENRLFLWVQFALQLFTSVSSHLMPSQRTLFSKEISIALSFIMLYNFFNLTTPSETKNAIDSQRVNVVIAGCIVGFLTLGFLPSIVTGFVITLFIETIIPDAFSLITPQGRLVLLYSLLTCVLAMLGETLGCNWLLNNANSECPWHLNFDLLFWQVLGGVVDIVILSPRPGLFIMQDNTINIDLKI